MIGMLSLEILIAAVALFSVWAAGAVLPLAPFAGAPEDLWAPGASAALVAVVARTVTRSGEAALRPLLVTLGWLTAVLVALWAARLAHAIMLVDTPDNLGFTEFFILGIIGKAALTIAFRTWWQPRAQRLPFAAIGFARFAFPFAVVLWLFTPSPQFVVAVTAAGAYLVLREATEGWPFALALGKWR